jgi:hypothetical protein
MKKHTLNLRVTLTAIVAAVGLTFGKASAQPMGGMDPQQMQQQIQQALMSACREQLVVTNDAEWTVIETRLSKLMQSKMEDFGSSMGILSLMRGRMGGRGGNGRGFPGMGTPTPEAEALQHALDAQAPASQLKAALEKQREARNRKKAEIAKAEDDLRKVLTLRQEATLVSLGVLN